MDTQFIEDLASSAPVPGGGGASAYVGAVASSLASMVANLTVGKKKYAAVEEQMQRELVELEATRARLLSLIDADAEAFKPLAACYRMPTATEEERAAKEAAIQAALPGACDVPIAIMKECLEVIASCEFLAEKGSVLAASDAGAAVLLAKAALQAASLNVFINIDSMLDSEQAGYYRDMVNDLISAGVAQADAVFAHVANAINM